MTPEEQELRRGVEVLFQWDAVEKSAAHLREHRDASPEFVAWASGLPMDRLRKLARAHENIPSETLVYHLSCGSPEAWANPATPMTLLSSLNAAPRPEGWQLALYSVWTGYDLGETEPLRAALVGVLKQRLSDTWAAEQKPTRMYGMLMTLLQALVFCREAWTSLQNPNALPTLALEQDLRSALVACLQPYLSAVCAGPVGERAQRYLCRVLTEGLRPEDTHAHPDDPEFTWRDVKFYLEVTSEGIFPGDEPTNPSLYMDIYQEWNAVYSQQIMSEVSSLLLTATQDLFSARPRCGSEPLSRVRRLLRETVQRPTVLDSIRAANFCGRLRERMPDIAERVPEWLWHQPALIFHE